MRTRIIPVVLLFAFVPLSAAQPPLAERIPAGTAVYVGWAGRTLPFEGSMLGQFLNEPAVSGLFEAIRKSALEDMHDEFERELFRRGWEMCGIAWQRPAALMVNFPNTDGRPDVELAVVVDLGRDRPQFAEHLDALVAAAGEEYAIEQQSTAGVTYRSVTVGPDRRLSFGFLEDVFFVYFGPGSPRKLLELNANGSLAQDADFQERIAAVDGEDIQIAFHIDADAVRRQLEPVWSEHSLDHLLTALGLDGVSAVAGTTRIVERGMYNRSRIFSAAPHRGVLSLFAGDELTDDDLSGVPADADFAWAAKFSLEDAYAELLRGLRQYDPDAEAEMLGAVEQFEQEVGLSLTDDLLASLGDTWVIASAPSYGGFLTGTLLTVDLTDSAKLAEALDSIVQQYEPMLGPSGPVRLMTTTVDRTEIRYVSVAGPYMFFPVAPAWSVGNDKLHVAGWPQVIEAAVVGTGARPLIDSSEYRSAREKIQGTPSILFYVNTPKIIKQTYQLALVGWTTGSHAMMGMADLSVRPDWLPALPTLQKYFRPQITAVSADDEGITFESYGSLPGTGMLSASAASPVTPAALLPALAHAREKARRISSQPNLRSIGIAMHIYAHEHRDAFPSDLDVLVDEGYIEVFTLTSPAGEARRGPDGDDEYDYVYAHPGLRAFDIPRRGEFVLVYERPENYDGRGTNVLFADASVTWLDIDEFEEAMRRTEEAIDELKGAEDF